MEIVQRRSGETVVIMGFLGWHPDFKLEFVVDTDGKNAKKLQK
jgi:hypothetical protein